MMSFLVIWLTLISGCYIGCTTTSSSYYCTPQNSTCWPDSTKWDAFEATLTGKLHAFSTSQYSECIAQGTDSIKISDTGNGICMQYHDCSKEFCDSTRGWNIPEYSVEVHTVEDIQRSIEFANTHNIAVTAKTSGHSYAGSSMGNGTLMIWMHNFTKYGDIKLNHSDSCRTVFPHAIKVGGGQPWNDIYRATGSEYHIVGGGALTVSAAGGWLMGSGLSAMGRKYGIGIDNVLNFEVVLANGSHVLADACTNPDLFWALRGGGGGTFGIVTSIHYRIRPAEPVVVFSFDISNVLTAYTVDKWLEKWVELSPNLDSRWGGYWFLNGGAFWFVGNMTEAERTFLNDFNTWKNSLPDEEKVAVTSSAKQSNSYFDSRGGPNITTEATGQKDFNIASRLIPRDWVVKNPKKATETLKWLVRNGFGTFNYLLGGVMQDIAGDDTAVHPAMRKAIWQINTFGEKMIQKLRDVVKDTGAGYNHASKNEPEWRDAFWGSNLERLQSLKKRYDPSNRFNCWHCVGYKGMEAVEPTPPPSETTTQTTTQTTTPSSAGKLVSLSVYFVSLIVCLCFF